MRKKQSDRAPLSELDVLKLVLSYALLIVAVIGLAAATYSRNSKGPPRSNAFNLEIPAASGSPQSVADASEEVEPYNNYDTRTEDVEPYRPEYHAPEVAEVDMRKAVDYQAGLIDYPLLRKTRADKQGRPVFPKQLQALDRRQVRLVGFMAPYDSLDRMNNFMLFPYPVGCYFCVPPSLTEVVLVRQARTDKAPYEAEAIMVTGQLHLWSEDSSDSGHKERFLFVLDSATVEKYRPDALKK